MKPNNAAAITTDMTTSSSIRTRKAKRPLGIVGFAIIGTLVVGPHLARDAEASPLGDADGPSLAQNDATVLAPAFAADDILGLPQGGATVGAGTINASLGAAQSGAANPGATTGGNSGQQGACPTGMMEVEGDYCPYVEQKCLRWLDPETKMRCAEFDPATKCDGRTTHKKFCIDQYEYPNQVGEKPVIMKTWYEAGAACKSEGKRLCQESEWTLACEGQDRLPYPYGYNRDSEACNIDKPHPDVNEKAIANPATREAEVERLWQGEPSGTREACVSPYGVHDMTGNVDEWVVNESGHPYKSGLKGGYWGPVRDRCRPMTVAHNETFVFYQIGFRCCEDDGSAASGSGAGAAKAGLGTGKAGVAVPSGGAQNGALRSLAGS